MDAEFAVQADALKQKLVEELWVLLKDKTTAGIHDYFGVEVDAKGTRFTQKMLGALDYLNIGAAK